MEPNLRPGQRLPAGRAEGSWNRDSAGHKAAKTTRPQRANRRRPRAKMRPPVAKVAGVLVRVAVRRTRTTRWWKRRTKSGGSTVPVTTRIWWKCSVRRSSRFCKDPPYHPSSFIVSNRTGYRPEGSQRPLVGHCRLGGSQAALGGGRRLAHVDAGFFQGDFCNPALPLRWLWPGS